MLRNLTNARVALTYSSSQLVPRISLKKRMTSTENSIIKATKRKLQNHAFPHFNLNFIGTGGCHISRYRGLPCMTLDLGMSQKLSIWIYVFFMIMRSIFDCHTQGTLDVEDLILIHQYAQVISEIYGYINNSICRFMFLLAH